MNNVKFTVMALSPVSVRSKDIQTFILKSKQEWV